MMNVNSDGYFFGSTGQPNSCGPSPPARWPKKTASVACAPCAGPFVASGEVLHRWSLKCAAQEDIDSTYKCIMLLCVLMCV